MMRLTREIRFAITDKYGERVSNSWAGWPATNSIVPHLTLTCTVEGEPHIQTGYVCNIKELDSLVRRVIVEKIIPIFESLETAEQLLRQIYRHCQQDWNSPVQIIQQSLAMTPYLRFTIQLENENMVTMTQQFEFSAAHRLHCDELSEAENRDLFGKCNNPEGHGHNYVVEISISRDSSENKGQVIELSKFETIVKSQVIDRLDHRHLNRDVEYFSGINPSVENIAVAVWNWLDGQFGKARLANVRVYETPKTWADYRR